MDINFAAVAATMLAYVVGTIPFGFLAARFVAGIDIRTHGSGNIGATNVGRVVGMKWGIAVLALDCLKGLLPVLFFPRLFVEEPSPHLQVACGIAAIVGHMYPFWLGFRGGKGVATTLGVILVMSHWATLTSAIVFFVTLATTRIVSLSSMLAAVALAVSQMILLSPEPLGSESWSLSIFCLAIPLLIVYRHRSNIGRLLRGEEPRIRDKPGGGAENAAR